MPYFSSFALKWRITSQNTLESFELDRCKALEHTLMSRALTCKKSWRILYSYCSNSTNCEISSYRSYQGLLDLTVDAVSIISYEVTSERTFLFMHTRLQILASLNLDAGVVLARITRFVHNVMTLLLFLFTRLKMDPSSIRDLSLRAEEHFDPMCFWL